MSPALRNGLLFLLLALVAAAIRLPGLDRRPMHTDEAVNAYITSQVLEGESFHYDPQDRHGPALFALTTPLERLAGHRTLAAMDEACFRRGAVLLSALVVLAFGLLARPLGLAPALLAAAFWILAPAPLYYGRYLIHESGFIAATIVFLAGLLRWSDHPRWPWVCGLGAGLMLAFKETAVLGWAAAGLALLLADRCGLVQRLRNVRALAAAVGTAVAIIIVTFTWGCTHPEGLAQLLKAAVRFTARATGEGHEKPWHYYLTLLAFGRAGPLLLLAAAVGVWRGWRAGAAGRILVIYTLVVAAVHMAIPYKTPWLALNLLLPLFLLAGLALAWRIPTAIAGGVILLTLFAFDGRRAVWRDSAGERNPFAYAHTTEDLLRLPDVVKDWQARHGRDPRIAVIADDPWPLPWYLRSWKRVGFWRPGQDPGEADIFITDLAPGAAVQPRLEPLIPEYFGVRPAALLVLWSAPRQPASAAP